MRRPLFSAGAPLIGSRPHGGRRLSGPPLLAGGVLISALVWLLLAWQSLWQGGVTWDEMLDFEGLNGAFWHGLNGLKGAHPDLTTITYDLEWFGNATRWPTYLLWRLLMIIPWERITTLSRTQTLLVSGYFSLNHLNAMVFALGGIGLTAALAWQLAGRRAGIFAGALLLLLPTWLGHGWMNSKDIPMATSYLLYTLGTTLLLRGRRGGAVSRLVGIGLMSGSRVGSLVFLALSEGVLLAPGGRRTPRRWLGSLAGGLLLGFLLTPQAWGDPLGYPLAAMRFISQRQGTGDSPGALRYIASNLFDLLPSPLLLGLALLLVTTVLGRRASGHGLPPVLLALPTLLQLLIPPTLLIVGGKSIYNELRHLLMIQPPLCVLAGLGYARATRLAGQAPGTGPASRLLIRSLLSLAGVATAVLLLELLLLSPYHYTYRSDLARLLGGPSAPALRQDYWGFSGRETLSRCLRQPACAAPFAQRPLMVDHQSFNPDLIEATATLLRPAPPQGPGGELLISTDPRTLATREPLAATRRVTLLPQPRRSTLSAIVTAAGDAP
ncbi:MAG: hypothetical protein VKO44_02765 [Cyanobacteriota bacterium]|nr:hypothetical protein [Cyanobacteriota bacterium]